MSKSKFKFSKMIKVTLALTLNIILSTILCQAASTTSVTSADIDESEVVSMTTEDSSTSGLLQQTTMTQESTSNFLLEGANADDSIPKITINPKLGEIDDKYSVCKGIEIREITIPQLQNLFASGQMTSVDLVKCYLDRLDKMNSVLKAVIDINPDAIKEAMKMDAERRAGKSRGPMHGIPVLLKEGIGTQGNKMETTAGSPALIGIHPKKDANLVTALRKAGAVILGKANQSEFYWVRGTNIPNGWSGRGGQTRNPYNLNETPEGSSSGSAVAVSANLCAVAVGTETDGSTIVPSSLNGICGMKATLGLVSTKGVIPLSHNQDYIGSMGRTITDVAILLDSLVCHSERPSQHPPSYYEYLLSSNISRPLRIGVLRYPYWDTSVINSTNLVKQLPALEEILDQIKSAPEFELVDPVEVTSKELFRKIAVSKEYIMLLHDLKHNFNEYLSNDVIHPSPSENYNSFPLRPAITSLKDVIQYNEEHPIPEGYNQEHLKAAEATGGLQNETYIEARDSNRAFAKELLDSVFEAYNLDAIVTPSDSRTQGMLEKSLEDFSPFGFSMACYAGYPSVQVPAGIGAEDSVPFGLTFVGKAYTEPVLLKVAHAVEQLSSLRKRPTFLISKSA